MTASVFAASSEWQAHILLRRCLLSTNLKNAISLPDIASGGSFSISMRGKQINSNNSMKKRTTKTKSQWQKVHWQYKTGNAKKGKREPNWRIEGEIRYSERVASPTWRRDEVFWKNDLPCEGDISCSGRVASITWKRYQLLRKSSLLPWRQDQVLRKSDLSYTKARLGAPERWPLLYRGEVRCTGKMTRPTRREIRYSGRVTSPTWRRGQVLWKTEYIPSDMCSRSFALVLTQYSIINKFFR